MKLDILASKTIRSIGYKSASRFLIYGLQALTTVVLARNLSAQDYGIAGYAMIFIGFLASFNDIGIGSALIQREQLDDAVLATAFSLRLSLGILAFCLAWILAPLAGLTFGDTSVSAVIRILSLGFLVSVLGFIPSALLLRDLDFGRWVLATLGGAIFRAAVACYLAIRGYGYWSIVLGSLGGTSIESLCFMVFSKHTVKLSWQKDVAGGLLRFGLPLFVSGLLTFSLFNADNLIIGAVSGASILGFYAIAFNWGSIFSKAIYEVLHSVLFPAFSRIQSETETLRRMYLRMMEQISFFGVLIQAGLLACSRDFLVIILGKGTDKWIPACHALQILSLYGLIRLLVEPVGNVLIAAGRTNLLLRANLLAAAVEIGLLYPVLKLGGIEGVAMLVTLSYALQCFIYWPFLKAHLNLSLRELGKSILPSILASIPALIAGLLLDKIAVGLLFRFSLRVCVVAAIFVTVQGQLSSWRWLADWKKLVGNRMSLARNS